MKKRIIAAMAVALIAGACGRDKPRGREPGSTSSAALAATGEKLDVPACLEWIDKLGTCIDTKAPPSVRAQMRDNLKSTTRTWTRTVSTPGGRAALENACRRMIDSSRRTTASMGCDW